MAERAERDRVASEQRGSPPEVARGFRLPQSLLPDALAAWELLQMLAPTLQVLFPENTNCQGLSCSQEFCMFPVLTPCPGRPICFTPCASQNGVS